MTLEPERDNPNDIRTKLAQHVLVHCASGAQNGRPVF